MSELLAWFEIPVKDINRAMTFYKTVMNIKMELTEMGGMPYAFFPYDGQGAGGALVQGETYQPSAGGVLVYFSGGEDLNEMLSRVEGAGGKIQLPKMSIGENGYSAIFSDTEGNSIGLHSLK